MRVLLPGFFAHLVAGAHVEPEHGVLARVFEILFA